MTRELEREYERIHNENTVHGLIRKIEAIFDRCTVYHKSNGQAVYTKTFNVAMKSAGSGVFTGYAATFDVDRQGDQILPGSFKRTIVESGGRWPVLMGHDQRHPIGFSTEANEDSKGLWVAGEFTMTSSEGRNAAESVAHAARCGISMGLSIGYMIPPGGSRLDERKGIRYLSAIDVFEFSVACIPANPHASISSLKGAY